MNPLCVLRLTQTEAPLGVQLAKFETSAVSSADPVTAEITTIGGVVTSVQELFATSQFFELRNEDRISKPGFLPIVAGENGPGARLGNPQTAAIV